MLKAVAKNFLLSSEVKSVGEYGNGLINNTYLLKCKNCDYIMQRINERVFHDIDALMSNISVVTEHISNFKMGYQSPIESLKIINTVDGKAFFTDNSGSYRVYEFIDGSVSKEKIDNFNTIYECGYAYGEFLNMVSGLSADRLFEILPDFHNTEKRYNDFITAKENDLFNRKKSAKKIVEFAESKRYISDAFKNRLHALPKRVIHNDTKLNNILYNAKTDRAMAVIDLDTIMAGSICTDFGDSVRSALGRMGIFSGDKIQLIEMYARGFLKGTDSFITDVERANLAMACLVITYECGLRFLTDYLSGDTYFKISYAAENLYKAESNFNQLVFLEENYDAIYKKIMSI